MTFRNRLVISSAIIIAVWLYWGYLFLSISQYSIVLIICDSSVAPNWISTSYLSFPSASWRSRSNLPAPWWILSLSLSITSPIPIIDGSSAIMSCNHLSFKTWWFYSLIVFNWTCFIFKDTIKLIVELKVKPNSYS